uniref:DNA repair endonuclease XPF isoform X2 n=1 Tax=Myxine glutinosa TaxID=7769 RepID=UPI00358FF26B
MAGLLDYETQIFLDLFHNDGLLLTARGLGIDRILLAFLRLYSDPANLVLVLNTSQAEETIRLQLDPVWHTLGAKSRSLVQDLRVLRTLLLCLTQYDAVTFLQLLESLWSSHKAFGQNSGWLFMDAANSMFVHTRARVYGYSVNNDSGKKTEGEKQELPLEKNPKWEALLEVIQEIERENIDSKDLGGPGQVLVCASDDKTCAQLRQLLCRGPDYLLQSMFKQSHFGSAGGSGSANSARGLDGKIDATDALDMPKISTEWLQPAGCIRNPSVVRGQKRPLTSKKRERERKETSRGSEGQRSEKGKKKKREEKESGLGKNPQDLTLTQMLQHHKKNESDQEEEDENDEGNELCYQDEEKAGVVEEEEQEEEMKSDLEEKNQEEERHQDQKKEDEVIKQECGDVKGVHENKAGGECEPSVQMSERLGLRDDSVAVLHPLRGSADPYGLTRVLRELQPRYVILYDADLGPVRQLEVFRASRPGLPLRVYFLMFEGSTEEQRYLTTLRKEKEAFEMLIREKASMVVPIEREGRDDTNLDLICDMRKSHATVDSWKAGGQVQGEIPRVVVDMREFRSELPALLHRRGFQIEPVTLEVGDYVLTPQLCVERKSISDLVSSLNNGRLFSQCTAMSRRYPRPALLIEFDAGQPFSLQDCAGGAAFQEISSHGITSKLALLTLHFPKLRLFWCPSPHAAAELFEELKQNKPEPDPQAAATISEEECGFAFPGSRFNTAPYDFLLRMPGVSEKTVRSLAREARSLTGLADMEESQLAEVLGSTVNAQRLWTFLHTPGAKALSSRNRLTGSRGGGGAMKGLGKAGRPGRVRR